MCVCPVHSSMKLGDDESRIIVPTVKVRGLQSQGRDGWESKWQMLPLHAQTGLPLLLMPATCSGKVKYIPKVYFPSAELILIYSTDPAFGS